MGTVFLGEHMLLGRRAAIKTLLSTVAINEEIVERFFNEARAAAAISDPGVIQIFDFGYHVDGTAYIVMELLEGEALSARIDRLGKLPLPDALRLARQIAGSLATAHACNIVHRDLKPDNIFIVRDVEAQGGERTKILDFGICKVGPMEGDVAVTQAGAMVGTPVYMSPEQCRGTSDVDHRSDIYAFGCLLFHMLTGRPPFIGEASGDLIVAHMQADPPAPSLYIAGLPFEIDALLLRCLAKAPEERFPSMNELHLVLGDIYAQLDTTDSTVAVVTPAMQLGQGFRSVYDANLASRISPVSRISPSRISPSPISPATHRLRPPFRFLATPHGTPPDLAPLRSASDLSDDDEIAALLRPQRTAVRAVFGGLVVAALVVALAMMPSLRDAAARRVEPETVAAAPEQTEPESAEPPAPAAAALAASMPEPPPPVVESSQQDRTVERASVLSEPSLSEPGVSPAAPTGTPTETKPAVETKAPAETRSPAGTRSPAEPRPPAQATGPVVTPAEVARSESKAPAAAKGPVVSPTEVAASSKPAQSAKPTETRSAAATRLATDAKPAPETDGKANVTTLTRPDPQPPAKQTPPRPNPTPPSPNEDLYDTR